jgi:hypothetical protein
VQKFVLNALANVPWASVEAVARDLMPHMRTPVFELPFGLSITEVVIVAFKSPSGESIHGGVYSVFCGRLIELILIDEVNRVDTSRRPAYAAFEIALRFGDLLFARDGLIDRVNWSVMDIGGPTARDAEQDPRNSEPIRRFVRQEYLKLPIPSSVGLRRLQ